MTKNQRQPKQNPRRGQRKTYSKLLPCDSKTINNSLTASCPLLFYQKLSHSQGIQPKLGTRSSCDFAISDKMHVSLGAYLDVRANRVTIKYERGL